MSLSNWEGILQLDMTAVAHYMMVLTLDMVLWMDDSISMNQLTFSSWALLFEFKLRLAVRVSCWSLMCKSVTSCVMDSYASGDSCFECKCMISLVLSLSVAMAEVSLGNPLGFVSIQNSVAGSWLWRMVICNSDDPNLPELRKPLDWITRHFLASHDSLC